MKPKMIALSSILLNATNPRMIEGNEFRKLKQSLKNDPEIMCVRPLVLNSKKDFTLLAGEQRYKALKELGYEEISDKWISFADDLTDEQKRKFILLDNYHSGTWDFTILAESWSAEELSSWDIVIPGMPQEKELGVDAGMLKDDTKQKVLGATDNEYSVFELVMLHENKLLLLETLNDVKEKHSLHKIEDSLMHIIGNYQN